LGAPQLTCNFPGDSVHRAGSRDQSWDQPVVWCNRAPRRRPRGHIEPLPSGSFRAVVFTGIDPLTRRRQYVRETCSTRVEAEKALTRLQGQVDGNRHPKSSITVTTAVEQ